VIVRIPTPLRSYTDGAPRVSATGSTVGEVLGDLDRQFPGLRFRVVDEQGRLRPHMRVFVGPDMVRDLATPLTGTEEVTLMQALSGG
jgi:molybdopterin synthase sulfur carrier subunit